jgi:BURP domain
VRNEILYVFITYKPLPSPAFIRSNFFLEKDIYPGASVKEGFSFNRTITGNAFVPRTEADAIPFSSNNFYKILEHFSMAQDSEAAQQIEKSLRNCEAPAMEGEKKFCATSLESLIDNAIALLGSNNIQAISTILNEPQYENMTYKIASPVKKLPNEDKLVICHPEPSPQAIFGYHTSVAYKGYIVPLVAKNGSTVIAVAVWLRCATMIE